MTKHNPINKVLWVHHSKVKANDYNPNAVAEDEMRLLVNSIMEDGITQPIVAFHDKDNDEYIVVDGFHRYTVLTSNKELRELNDDQVPIVVIDKPLKDRMASTVRHNRARGKHSINGMSSLVFKMLEEGATESEVCNKLGMTPEEVLRLKHTTGYSYLYRDANYNSAWETPGQVKLRREHADRAKAK